MKEPRWEDILRKRFSVEEIERIKVETWKQLLQVDLKELRGLAGIAPQELAALAKLTQSQIS